MKIRNKTILYITCIISLLVVLASLGGICFSHTYMYETANWRTQALAQDTVDLYLLCPLLIAAGLAAYYGNRVGFFVFGGCLIFLIYTFAIYCFAAHFNSLFLVYCLAFGLSSYALTWLLLFSGFSTSLYWFHADTGTKISGTFLLFFGILFYLLWLSDVVPAIVHHTTPKSVTAAGLLTNPVHVLDLSLVLPLFIIAGMGLLRKKPMAFLLASLLLVFGALMNLNIAALLIYLRQRGTGGSLTIISVMLLLALVCLLLFIVLINSFGQLKTNKPDKAVPGQL